MPIKYDPDAPTFTTEEERLANAINEAGAKGVNRAAVAAGIAASFVLYRRFMSRRMKQEIAKDPMKYGTGVDPYIELASRVLGMYMSKWIPTLALNAAAGYAMGLKEVGQTNPAWAKAAAERYARTLGDSVHTTSVQAMVEGISAQVNRGVPIRAAADRVIDAFGVTPQSMRALVNLWTKTPEKRTTTRAGANDLKSKIDQKIADAITRRSVTLGETESRLTANVAKSLYWSYQVDKGDLPPTAEKEWITTLDERTCEVCGPLHRQKILVSERFQTSIGPIMAPGVHPNCRCELVLHPNADLSDLLGEGRLVRKAMGTDKYDRDKSGQFASQESRGPGTQARKARFKQYGENLVQRKEQERKPVTLKPLVQMKQMSMLKQPAQAKQMTQSNLRQAELKQRTELRQGLVTHSEVKQQISESKLRASVSMTKVARMVAEAVDNKEAKLHYVNTKGHIAWTAAEEAGVEINAEDFIVECDQDIDDAVTALADRHHSYYGELGDVAEAVATGVPRSDPSHHDEVIVFSMSDGSTGVIERQYLREAAEALFIGDDIRLPFAKVANGRGHVLASSQESIAASDLLNSMGDSGDDFINDIVGLRPTAIVTDGKSRVDNPDYLNHEIDYHDAGIDYIDDRYVEQRKIPWDNRWASETPLVGYGSDPE